MKAERVILSFLALLIGLGVAGGVFYLYQMTKATPSSTSDTTPTVVIPSPTPDTEGYVLIVDKPSDETVVEKSPITVSGQTEKGALVVVRSETNETVANPASNGKFTLTFPLVQGENIVQILAVYEDGSEKSVLRTVTLSTEDF